MRVTLSDFIYFAGALATILVGSVVVIYHGTKPGNNRFLSIALFSLGYILVAFFLLETRLLLHVPHLYRTGSIAGFLFWPAFYLYVRLTFKPAPLKVRDLIHLLPAFLFIIDFAPFFILSADEKIQILSKKAYPQLIVDLSEGWLLPVTLYSVVRLGQIVLYWGLQAYLVYNWYITNKRRETNMMRTWLRWFVLLLTAELILTIPAVMLVSGQRLDDYRTWVTTTIGLMALLVTVMLLLQPHILYGLQSLVQLGAGKITTQATNYPDKSVTELIPEQPWADDLHQRLTTLMHQQQPFLKQGYSLPDLANDTGVPVHQLSNYINNTYGMNFNEYINQFRIAHFKRRLQRHDWSHMTLEALAIESGFSNRFTFTNAFKRITGTTPSDYLRTIRQAS